MRDPDLTYSGLIHRQFGAGLVRVAQVFDIPQNAAAGAGSLVMVTTGSLMAFVWGAGGGARYQSTLAGGAGGLAFRQADVVSGQTINWVLGAPGIGGTVGTPNGGNGGDTTLTFPDGVIITGEGGKGGGTGGGLGGFGSGGQLHKRGGNGGNTGNQAGQAGEDSGAPGGAAGGANGAGGGGAAGCAAIAGRLDYMGLGFGGQTVGATNQGGGGGFANTGFGGVAGGIGRVLLWLLVQ